MHQTSSSSCMRCNATEELSIKYRTKLGAPRYLCRPCRRGEWHKKKEVWRPKPDEAEKRRIERAIFWSMLAGEINGRIINKYSRIQT